MDENNQEQNFNNNNHYHHHGECFLCKHPWLKLLLTGLMTLLGAYLAFYVVTDWHYKRMLDPAIQLRKMDRMIQKEEHQMHKMFSKEFAQEKKLGQKANDLIQVEQTDDAYKIIIDLKPFNNNEKNVTVTREDNSLTINLAGEVKKYNKDLLVHLTQKFIFPEKADLEDLSKFKDGNKYYIVVPIRD